MTLEPEGLESNLNTLVEYNQLNKNKLQHIWVSNINNELIENIMQYANQYEWELPRRQPLHMIDHSFGPLELAFPLSLAILTEATRKRAKNSWLFVKNHKKLKQSGFV